jgi:hypothetical protein
LADKDPAIWQARYVAEFGSSTLRTEGLVFGAPLKVERSNFPIGADIGSSTNPLVVTAEYLKLSFALPSDLDGTFTGKVRIYRKAREFSRDILDVSSPPVDSDPATLVYADDLVALIGVLDRLTYSDGLELLDQEIGSGSLWYYTVFYEMGVGVWAFDPANSIARNWAYAQYVDADTLPYSPMGSRMYADLPRAVKIYDYKVANLATERFYQILGRMFDQIKEEIEFLKRIKSNVDDMDFQDLSYTDWLLGWPTNFELREEKRRIETKQAPALWKAKGTIDSLELALQTVTGWNVTIYEGWKWVATTYNNELILDPASPPAGWNPATDGVWADLVDTVPSATRVFDTATDFRTNTGFPGDKKTYLPSNEIVTENGGVGWWWQNPNGILVLLEPASGADITLTEVIVAKVARLAPMFALHYAAFTIAIRTEHTEEWQPLGADLVTEYSADGLTEEDYTFFGDEAVTDTVDLAYLYTWPHPDYPLGSRVGNEDYTVYHGWLTYTEDVETEDMPQHLHLSSDQIVTHGVPDIAVGQHKLDPSSYSGSRVFYFAAIGEVGGLTAAKSITVVLWDLDNGEAVSTLTLNDVTSDRTISSALVVGSAAGNLKDSLTNYEVRASLNGSAVASDFGSLGNIFLLVE